MGEAKAAWLTGMHLNSELLFANRVGYSRLLGIAPQLHELGIML
jgi:hypothetical protein